MIGEEQEPRRIAVVLFNLGGPDRPESVQPFLFNLFNDPAIISAPGPIRWLLAHLISSRRAPTARQIYAELGGGSPLLANSERQAEALQAALSGFGEVRVFVCMRYWHPMSDETARAVAAFEPERIILLPLYPQYSTTTTGSSLVAWRRAAAAAGVKAETKAVCCYPWAEGFATAVADLLRPALDQAAGQGRPRVLFSAHGLPKKIIERGDPYQWQVEQSVEAVVRKLAVADLDHVVCYQSRVGPLEWIGPSTDAEIERAGRDCAPVVLVPIAFVSEHSETLVELDIEYRKLAEEKGVPAYIRVATVDAAASFIASLAELVRAAHADPAPLRSLDGSRICPAEWSRCGYRQADG